MVCGLTYHNKICPPVPRRVLYKCTSTTVFLLSINEREVLFHMIICVLYLFINFVVLRQEACRQIFERFHSENIKMNSVKLYILQRKFHYLIFFFFVLLKISSFEMQNQSIYHGNSISFFCGNS